MLKKKGWTHKKFCKKNEFYVGYYQKFNGNRVFNLTNGVTKKDKTYESHQAAKKAGWVAK